MEKDEIRYVVVVQCQKARERCSGFACSNAFFERQAAFEGYAEGTKFMTVTCGGCMGSAVSGQLEHFAKKLTKKTGLTKDQAAVHLSSCMVTDNHHHDRCPHLAYIRDIVRQKGFARLVEGSYQSQAARKRRQKGEYKRYDSVDFD